MHAVFFCKDSFVYIVNTTYLILCFSFSSAINKETKLR
jgi:hypothetical protein